MPSVLPPLFALVKVEAVLLRVLVSLAVLIVAARLFAVLFRRLRQPGVVGEIVAGLVLGPSVFGRLAHLLGPQGLGWLPWDAAQVIFPATVVFHGGTPTEEVVSVEWIFRIISQLGLVFLLFLIGLECDFRHLRRHGQSALAISLVGIALPFVLGLGLGFLLQAQPGVYAEGETPAPPLSFALFLGTTLAITAIPVLGRIMLELNITRTRLGAITISAAAVDDAAGWILLATVAAIVQAQFRFTELALMIAATAAFAVAMVFLVRPVLCSWLRRVLQRNGGELSVNALALVLVGVLLCAVATNLIGIFAIFGAFLLGAVLSGEEQFREAVARRLRDFVTAFFLPIFFTYTGLHTNVYSLGSWSLWLWCALVLAAAVVGKLAGCGLAAWAGGSSPREASCIGAMMNTRGLMGLIVINVGRDLGVIPASVACMLVLMALATTMMTTPLLLGLMRGTELEPYIVRSGFIGDTLAAPRTEQAGDAEEPLPERAGEGSS
jgi:Kef-type K+ transport system membrane component KefB